MKQLLLLCLIIVLAACAQTTQIEPNTLEPMPTSAYEPVGESPPFAITPMPDVFMPQLKQRDAAFMEALLVGELVVDEGCLRVASENESYLVIWQADYFLTDNNGRLEILDESGAVIAHGEETIYMGGGEQPTVDDAELRQPVPEQCGGPYWRMGQFLPEEYIPTVASKPASQSQTDEWQTYTVPGLNLSFDYPAAWFVHGTDKTLQITPNAQPAWSSFFDPDQPHGGPVFDLMHNLSRLMEPTPLAAAENLLDSYEAELEAIEPFAALPARPDVVTGVYRFTIDEDDMALLVGAITNPNAESPQRTIAMTSVVPQDELATLKPIFETVLGSLRLADAPED